MLQTIPRHDSILTALREGQRQFTARFARRDTEDGTAPDWSEPRPITLRVTVRERDVRHGRTLYRAGELLSITPTEMNWAEYNERDYCGNGEFLIEEWRMQLLAVR